MTEWLRVLAALAEEPGSVPSRSQPQFPGNMCMVQIHAEKNHTYLQNKVNLERKVELSLNYNKTIAILSQTVRCFKYTAKIIFHVKQSPSDDYISYEMLYSKNSITTKTRKCAQ